MPRRESNRPLALSFPVAGAAVAAGLYSALTTLSIVRMHPHLELGALELAALVVQLVVLYGFPALVLGGGVEFGLRRLGVDHLGGAVAGLFFAAALGLWVWGATGTPSSVTTQKSTSILESKAKPAAVPEPPGDPPPVVLLVVDGADPSMMREMIAEGDLPTFARLLDESTFGPLATLRPTLSPRVWSTLATGCTPEDHGIHHFTRYRLPGIKGAFDRFPRGSGLTHQIFPRLEKIASSGWHRVPYTSDTRRCAALWEIAGERGPVGVYRWLITWPAEPVEGFMVAGGLWAGGRWHPDSQRWLERMKNDPSRPHEEGWFHPPDLNKSLPAPRGPVRDAELRPYLTEGELPDRSDPDLRLVVQSLRESTLEDLRFLVAQEMPRFLAAAFYSVDAFGHRFVHQHVGGGPFAPAWRERYRHTDRRLGALADFLDEAYGTYHLLVVSDHGWDLEAGHHLDAPPGIFLARGPAFTPGRRVVGASVFHVAPVVLHLLGLPVAESMPGAVDFDQLLASGSPPPQWVASYPRQSRPEVAPQALDEARRQQLRSLGYLP